MKKPSKQQIERIKSQVLFAQAMIVLGYVIARFVKISM